MTKYQVHITELWIHTIDVLAETKDEALWKALSGDGDSILTEYDRTPDIVDGVKVNAIESSVFVHPSNVTSRYSE